VQARYRGNKRRSEEAEEHRHASKLQAVFRGHRARQTAELRSSQKRALAEMKARQQALAEQEKHATATLKVDLPKDWRHRIARLLDKPRSSWASMSVLVVLMLAIIASLLSFFMLTMPEFQAEGSDREIRALEATCGAIFTLEVLARTYVATLDLKRLLLLDITYWIDIVCIVPYYVELAVRGAQGDGAELPAAFRFLQLLRLLRILKLLRHYSGWRVLLVALYNSWRALLVPVFAMLMTIFILAGALFLAEDAAQKARATGGGGLGGAGLGNLSALGTSDDEVESFRSGWDTMWVCFWLVTTLGYDGYLGSGEAGGRVVIAVALVCGLLFTTMPITIIGEAFRAAWEKKELIEVQMKIQELLIDRGLPLSELHKIFAEFDTSGDMQLDWAEFKGALKKLGVKVPLAKMRALFSMFDEDDTQEVDYIEFCRLLYPNYDMVANANCEITDDDLEDDAATPVDGAPAGSVASSALAVFTRTTPSPSSQFIKVHPAPPAP